MNKLFLLVVSVLLFQIQAFAQNTLAGNLTVQQSVKYTGVLTPTALSGDVNDYAPTNFAANSLIRLSSDQAGRTISGLAGGAAGRMVWLTNVGSFAIVFSDDSVSSTAANRFDFGSSDFSLVAGSTLALWYDSTSSRWRPQINTASQTDITGNAATATALRTARTINGVSFDGTSNITVAAAAGTLTGATLAANVTASSLLSAAGGSFGTAAFTATTAYEVPLTFSTPLSRSVNTISIANAAADGSTKGAAAFAASDFDATSGVISIDYTNGQTASGSAKGFLNSTDWATFNGKQAAGNYITALTGDVTASGPGSVSSTVTKINGVSLAGLATGILKNTTSTGAPSIAVSADFPTLNQNTTGSAATLTTPRAIYGNSFDGSAALTQIIASTFGGTGNGFTKFSGPTTSEKTFTLPNANAVILTDNAVVTVPQGGTGLATIASGKMFYASATDTIAPLTQGNTVVITGGVLDTTQDLRTSATPQFSRLGLGNAADSIAVLKLNGKLITATAPPTQNYATAYDDYHNLTAIGIPNASGVSNPVGLRMNHEILGATNWTEAVGAWIELQLLGTAGTGRVIGVDGFGILGGTGMAATQWSSFNAGVRISGTGSITTEYNGYLADFTEVTGAGDISGKIAGLRVRTGFGRAAASQVNGVYVDSLTASGSGRTAAIEANQTAATDSYNIYMASTAVNRLNGPLQMVSADIVAGDNGGAATWQGQSGLVGRGVYVQRAGANAGLHALAVGSTNALVDLSQARGAYGALTATQSGDTLIHMGRFYDGATWFQAARIDFSADENASSTNRGTNMQFKTITSGSTTLDTRFQISGAGSILAGRQVALSTSATDGFLYAPGCAGAPSGTATGVTGLVPLVVDTTNNNLCFYAGSAWRTLPSKTTRQLFDHYTDAGNVSTSETDLYSDTVVAGQLANNGDKLISNYGGKFVSSVTATRQIKVYFGGTAIFDSGTLTLSSSSSWTVSTRVIRVSSSVVRYSVCLSTQGAALPVYTSVGELTGLSLTSSNILKITGQAAGTGAATDDVKAQLGDVQYVPGA